jgi:hypothetical protein
VEAAASAMPASPALRLTVPQAPSVQVAPAPIVNGVVAAIAILLACLETSANPDSSAPTNSAASRKASLLRPPVRPGP